MMVGCTETYELRGRQVRVEADLGLEMCGGTLAHMDRFVERFAGELGLPLTGEPWIDYRWITPDSFAERNPCAGMPACAVVRTVYASEIAFEHEIVHAAASDLGLAHPFLIEGLAMAFEGGARDADPELDALGEAGDDGEARPPPRVLAALRAGHVWLPGEHYVIAGAFTRYLIDRFGLRRYLDYYRRTWYADRYPALARAFAAAFGASLVDAVTEFEATRLGCGYSGYRFKLLECDAPALEWDGARLARRLTVDCDDADAVGEAGASVRVVRTLEVPTSGRYLLEARDGHGVALTLGSCGGCERRAIARTDAADDRVEVELPAGRYFLRAETAARAPVSVGVVMQRVGE